MEVVWAPVAAGALILALRAWRRYRAVGFRWGAQANLLAECSRLFEKKRYSDAAKLLSNYVHRHPKASHVVYSRLGAAYFYSSRYKEAHRALQTAVSGNPHDRWAEGLLGCTLRFVGDDMGAKATVARALDELSEERRLTLLRWWARASEDANDSEAAAAAYEKILHECPADFRSACGLAMSSLRLGRRVVAKDVFLKALAAAPEMERARILSSWSSVAWGHGEFSLLVETYECVLAQHANDWSTLRRCALVLAGAPDASIRNASRAVEYATRVCEHEQWTDWRSVSVLAAAHAENGDFQNAVKYAKLAGDLAPPEQAEERKRRIDQYERGEPYRIRYDQPTGRPPSNLPGEPEV